MKTLINFAIIGICLAASFSFADTIVNNKTGETYHGYLTGAESGGIFDANTTEKGIIKINLSEFTVTRDTKGRNNSFALIEVSDIMAGMETTAFEALLKKTVAAGPLFILLEIDSPGGRVDLCKRMCAAVKDCKYCDVYAYIDGGKNGGAYSAAAVLSMACDKIYMAPGTVIGAATMITMDSNGAPTDMKSALGDTVGEKMSSAWRNYMASLASEKNRPAALALAMENKDIEVVEIKENGKRAFVDSVNKKPNDVVVKIWSKKGELLTLPAKDAIDCGMADKIYANRQDLLADHNATTAQIITDNSMTEARELYERITKRLDKLNASIDLGLKQLDATHSRVQAMKSLKGMIQDAQFALSMKKRFGDDMPINEQKVQSFLNDAQATYDSLKVTRR
jgi:ATP-dependent protease ClpP protease subunit